MIIVYITYYIIQGVSKMVQVDKIYAKINRERKIIFFCLKFYFQISFIFKFKKFSNINEIGYSLIKYE